MNKPRSRLLASLGCMALLYAGFFFFSSAAVAIMLPQEKEEAGVVDEPVE